MMYVRLVGTVLLLVSIPLLLDPPEGSACGPFLPTAQFGFVHNPSPRFVHGELGIVKPQYYRRNLIVAYRYLSHVPLAVSEVHALDPPPSVQPEWPANLEPGGPLAAARWLSQRNAVAGFQPVRRIEVYRTTITNGYYSAYPNCLDDAFDSATATLAERTSRWGIKSPQTAEWIRGQDEVFANCDGHPPMPGIPLTPAEVSANQPHIPAALPAGANPLLAADRQYQIAAAVFYAGEFAEAEKDFREVAANAGSPWHESGLYLAARALIREGTVDGSQAALDAAEKVLQGILHDPKQERWHASARGLLEFVRARLYAEERLVELGAALSKPGLGTGIVQAIDDYTAIWDRQQRGPVARSDVADWITAFQRRDEPHAIARWRAGGGVPWLVAALAAAQPADAATPELIAAARKLPPADPAYATAAYHGIRLQVARRQGDDARQWADEALAAKLPVEAQNAFRAERMSLARDWREFLRDAPRRPVAAEVVYTDEAASGYPNVEADAPAFDHDAADALNRKVPLDLWIDASRNPLLPARLQAQIAQAGWVRAVLLNHAAQARALAERVAELRPELAAAMRSYAAEKYADAATFDAVFLMLHTPGLAPFVREGFGREGKLRQVDMFRDNWWKLRAAAVGESAPAPFLPDAQRAAGEKEWAALLDTAANGPDYLCAGTLTWARVHRQDPRVPEALYWGVRATRSGPTDEDTSGYSRKVFQLLHARYPNTEWAKQTKYWY